MKNLLIVDDEIGSRESLYEIFCKRYSVHTAVNAQDGLAILSRQPLDLIVSDLVMPGMDGLSFLKEVREIYPEIPVIMISGSTANQSMESALELGAVGFIKKPFDIHELRQIVAQTITASEVPRHREVLQKEMVKEFSLLNIVGQSAAFRKAIEDARKISKTGAPVMIVGEAGVGKEFVARQVHSWSQRSEDSFLTIRCSGSTQSSLEAEIFGTARNNEASYQRGAYDIVGNGSIFLEGVDLLPVSIQAQLGEVLEQGKFQRAGSPQLVPTNARILATAKVPAGGRVEGVKLQPELARAFAGSTIWVPPLRERVEDIPLLAYHFLNQLCSALNVRVLDISSETMEYFRRYSWPGNIRELRNVIERMLVLNGTQTCLEAASLPDEFGAHPSARSGIELAGDFTKSVNAFERQLIVGALQRSNGVVKTAAVLLQTTPRVLQYRIDKLGIRKVAG